MENLEVINDVNKTLELVTFYEVDVDRFQLAGSYSPWVLGFCPGLFENAIVDLKKTFVFLDDFIEQAREYFQDSDSAKLSSSPPTSLSSGPWSERDLNNVERNLSATAINLKDGLVIQVRHISEDGLFHRRIFQKAREYGLDFEHMQREKELKDTLIYAVVHDLSGPLTAISSIVEMLSQMESEHGNRKQLFAKAKSHIERTHKMIRSILEVFDAQRHEFSGDSLQVEQAPKILSIAESVVADFYPVFRHQGVTLDLDNKLSDQEQKIVGNGEKLARVFINLLENALRFSPIRSHVTVTLTDNEDEVFVNIVDQGKGVPEILVNSLFRRFVGGREHGGKAGFGLYFCQMCLSKWGGRIEYMTAGNKYGDDSQGACFELTMKKYPLLAVQKTI